MPVTVARIDRYPVKGLSAERLAAVELRPGEGLPQDRRFALAHGASRFDPARPAWLPKREFLMLMANERLAALDSRFDETSGTLTLRRDGSEVARADITGEEGRAAIAGFMADYLGAEARGLPRLVEAPGHMFSDCPAKVVSLINRASVEDLGERLGRSVDPRRFRGNLLIEGAPAWAELDWIGRTLALGEARLRVSARIDRCAATNVAPGEGVRDMNIPKALRDLYGHVDCGVYAEVVIGGRVAAGDEIRLLPEAAPA